MKAILFLLLGFSSALFANENHLLKDSDTDSFREENPRNERSKRLRAKKGRQGRGGEGRFRKKMKDDVGQWIKGLPEDQAAQAQKVVQYLHTSNEVSRMYIREKRFQEAIKVLEKRSRLKLPPVFTSAPPFIKAVKAHTYMELGSIYGKQGQWNMAVKSLETAMQESGKEGVPDMLKTKVRMELMRAYKKAGMEAKASGMMEATLKEAEAGLEFE
ncbi:hypothetical protein HOF92_13045 [bacterium]|jgi:hypothetical protein|nr:hypothetical protein [bacterium]